MKKVEKANMEERLITFQDLEKRLNLAKEAKKRENNSPLPTSEKGRKANERANQTRINYLRILFDLYGSQEDCERLENSISRGEI